MTPLELNEATVKRLFKEALVETLHEHRNLLREIVADVLDDAGMLEAIRRGRRTKTITRDGALRALEARSESFLQRRASRAGKTAPCAGPKDPRTEECTTDSARRYGFTRTYFCRLRGRGSPP